MIALLQRVTHANVVVNGIQIAQINQGLLVLIGVERGDSRITAARLLKKILHYRVFSDENDKMNLSVTDINGGLLLVPQFTLAANTDKGLRPSFTPAESPSQGNALFDYLCQQAKATYSDVHIGQFGADMKVSLTNDGPVTFWLQIKPDISKEPLHG
ncbi:MAG: D-aminoacyl-tRNA deacylase [Gammaproteobacteria bacterium]|nr:D-aminoacyl-tRNA deacylase [Gammaproteobacteria bacterium]MDT8371166.1 D-aminoacyl-tRNA deacylase [Gammaproteobacteria bacterium]